MGGGSRRVFSHPDALVPRPRRRPAAGHPGGLARPRRPGRGDRDGDRIGYDGVLWRPARGRGGWTCRARTWTGPPAAHARRLRRSEGRVRRRPAPGRGRWRMDRPRSRCGGAGGGPGGGGRRTRRGPAGAVLGPQVAQVFADLHRDHGVELRTSSGVARFLGTGGTLEAVELTDGTRLDADLALVAVGAVPRTELAEAAGLAVDDGVLVDAHLRTADPRVAAAGDIANVDHPVLGRRVRVEHWANAKARGRWRRGPCSVRTPPTATCRSSSPTSTTSAWSTSVTPRRLLRPRRAARGCRGAAFVAFWLSGSRVVAAMHVNTWDATEPLTTLVGSGRAVDAERLTAPRCRSTSCERADRRAVIVRRVDRPGWWSRPGRRG